LLLLLLLPRQRRTTLTLPLMSDAVPDSVGLGKPSLDEKEILQLPHLHFTVTVWV
jgi:hypothetical protein